MRAADSFDSAVDFLDDRLRTVLLGVDSRVKESAYEIRLRAARPVVIVTRVGSLFVYKSGRTGSVYSPGALAATPAELQTSFSRMCGYSVHSNSAAAASGFISLAHGHRAGVCGTAVMAESGTVKSFRDISSVNLRIAHEIPGSSDEIYPSLFSHGIVSAIIAGPPLSGKTTLLRDLARRLSGVSGGRYYRVAIVDERGEIAASSGGCPQCDVGFSDVLTGYPKDVGILTALRTLSPQIIICDEIGNLSETKRILEGMNSGVNFLVSVHVGKDEDLRSRPAAAELLSSGVFSKLVMLGEFPGETAGIYDLKEHFYANDRSRPDGVGAAARGRICGAYAEPAREPAGKDMHYAARCADSA